jgi:hypothetical protein
MAKSSGRKRFNFEKHSEPLLPSHLYYKRLFNHISLGVYLLTASLLIGILGYHITEGLNWVDSLLNASMILGGMGPVDLLKTDAGKIFASFYALFSGVVFLVTAGVVFAPVIHRFLHKLHIHEKTK